MHSSNGNTSTLASGDLLLNLERAALLDSCLKQVKKLQECTDLSFATLHSFHDELDKLVVLHTNAVSGVDQGHIFVVRVDSLLSKGTAIKTAFASVCAVLSIPVPRTVYEAKQNANNSRFQWCATTTFSPPFAARAYSFQKMSYNQKAAEAQSLDALYGRIKADLSTPAPLTVPVVPTMSLSVDQVRAKLSVPTNVGNLKRSLRQSGLKFKRKELQDILRQNPLVFSEVVTGTEKLWKLI
jgi:hypothetical protein